MTPVIVRKAVNMAGMMNIPVLGLVENMSYALCPDCGKKIQVFGKSHLDEVAASFELPILDHCEDNFLAAGGVMNEGKWSVLLGMNGMTGAAEELMIARNIILARQFQWPIHMQHVSVKESVELIRKARAEGIPVTGEATPHHLSLTDDCIKTYDTNYKMNPPLRGREDRLALIQGIKDGVVDCIATDHAPHSAEEKSRGLEKSAFGVVGIETALPILYTYLVKPGVITLEKLIDLLANNPRKRFGIPMGEEFTVWDLEAEEVVDPETFLSKGKATPFTGYTLTGKCMLTVCDGKIVYEFH